MKITLEDKENGQKVIIDAEDVETGSDIVDRLFGPAMLALTFAPETVNEAFYNYAIDRMPDLEDEEEDVDDGAKEESESPF
jgi:hypothetical protein